ncbi:hypothetical protein DNTS_021198 [Danionella cerebrum]|uniref:Uncharacterized protein n=1 Tax=Danionella cerebrum TaxID=2873325 RepID=A0A553RFG7_9TELE|nr:hypothetical protein DNTS_021198 [Danionella translucida]
MTNRGVPEEEESSAADETKTQKKKTEFRDHLKLEQKSSIELYRPKFSLGAARDVEVHSLQKSLTEEKASGSSSESFSHQPSDQQ